MTFGNRDLIAASPEYAHANTRLSNEIDPVIRALEPATEEEYGYPWRYKPGYWTEMRPIDKTWEDIYREFAQSLAAKGLKHGYVMDGPPGDGSAPREVIVPLDAKLAFQEEELR
jgi:hypothetical protein